MLLTPGDGSLATVIIVAETTTAHSSIFNEEVSFRGEYRLLLLRGHVFVADRASRDLGLAIRPKIGGG